MVSVIVPVYQAGEYLEACIGSVLAQSLPDWELILVNDGSTDRSGQICAGYVERDERIRVIHQENRGVSEARNAGMKAARGVYIAFLDADDRFEPDMLRKLVDIMESSGADCAGCSHINEYPDGRLEYEDLGIAAATYEGTALRNLTVRKLFRERLEGDKLFNGFIWRFLYKTDIIRDNKLSFTGAYLEDELFLIEYFSIAGKLSVISDALYIYSKNPSSVTRKYMPDFLNVFSCSYSIKKELAVKYRVENIEGWQYHTLWAGLLIAVANEFAHGNTSGFRAKRGELIRLCREPLFAKAVSGLKPRNITGNKKLVARLIRMKQYTLLSLLYTVKNRS